MKHKYSFYLIVFIASLIPIYLFIELIIEILEERKEKNENKLRKNKR